jgi:cytochrome c oxidase subunit 2
MAQSATPTARSQRVRIRRATLVPAILTLVTASIVAGCEAAPSPLDPRTLAAARIAELGWVMIGLAAIVCIVVYVALLLALRAAPRGPVRTPGHARVNAPPTPNPEQEQAESGANKAVIVAGLVLPAAILLFTFGYTVYTLRQVAGVAGTGGGSTFPAHAEHLAGASVGAASSDLLPAVTIHLTGHQWWWQIEYPDAQIVTANEIHVPVGVPIQVRLTSEDVIHSFWVPQVTGKVDLIPGKANFLTIRPDQPGTYRGVCGEFCGLQHAHMHLRLIVESAEEYVGWLDRERQPAAAPATPEAIAGQRLFVANCGECHTVRGATDGTRGPDLTHLASRRTLGAGIHENTRENLSGWTRDAQSMKPGNKMPSIALPDADLAALVAYLESLE